MPPSALPGAGEQFVFVDAAQHEQQLRLLVEPGADAVEHRGDVLAHVGPVRAAARQLDLVRRRKQAVAFPADPVHHALGEPALQQLHQRVDRARAVAADRLPARRATGAMVTLTL